MNSKTSNSVEKFQSALYAKSKSDPKLRFNNLYENVYRRDVLAEAWKRAREKRNGVGGVDGKTIVHIEKDNGAQQLLAAIKRELKEGKYRPNCIRRAYLPKPAGGLRTIGVPTVKDKVVQAATKIVIEPIFEADFQDFSYAYRPNRSIHDAAAEVEQHLKHGCTSVIDADISNCFGSINHGSLIKAVKARIADKKILTLLKTWLKAGVLENGKVHKNNIGTPEGGVISPLLANIYLNYVDTEWINCKMHEKHDAHLVRYADDCIILVNSQCDTMKPFKMMKKFISRLGLELNDDKTRIVDAERESFEFLGFRFDRTWEIRKIQSRELE